MSDVDPDHEIVVQRLMQRLHCSAPGFYLDLSDATVRYIIERVIADMPDAEDLDRLARAKARMVLAAR